MRNLSIEAREKDLRIRLDLGLPMVDDADDFLASCAEAIAERDATITELRDKIEEGDKIILELCDEIEEGNKVISDLKARLP